MAAPGNHARQGGSSSGPSRLSPFVPVGSFHGGVSAAVAGPGGVLYGAVSSRQRPRMQVIVRVQAASGRRRMSRALPGGDDGGQRLTITEGGLWVATGASNAPRSSRLLVRLNPATLRIEERITLPAPPTGIAATPAGLWVAAGWNLFLVDPVTGTILRTVAAGGPVGPIAADPSGRRLYVATHGPAVHDLEPLLELDGSTGAVVATGRAGYAELDGVSGLTATRKGVWVSTPTGMLGALSFYGSEDLLQARQFEQNGSNGITSSLASGRLWVYWSGGWLQCTDPVTGASLGRIGSRRMAGVSTGVLATRGGLFAGGWESFVRIRPRGACRR
jgi:hypothetical protein